MKTAIIVISEAGIALAKTLEQELPESEIFSTGTDTDLPLYFQSPGGRS